MYLNYNQIEYAIKNDKNLNYFVHGIIWKRRFPFLILMVFVLNIIFSYVWGEEHAIEDYQYFLLAPLLSYSIAAICMFISEIMIFKNFQELDKDRKLKNVKLFYILFNGFSWFGLIAGIGRDWLFEPLSKLVLMHLSLIVITTVLSWIYSFWDFKKLKDEIERKGLIVDH